MLRTLKKVKLFNYIFRNLLKFIKESYGLLEKNFINRFDIAGTVIIKVKDRKLSLFSECDDHAVRDLYYENDWEKSELEVWTIFAEKTHVIFDIGANTGVYSVISSKFNPNAVIYAFEPNPINLERMKYNLKLNDCKNVFLIEKAVGDNLSAINFTVPVDDSISLVSSAIGSFSESFFNISYKEIEVDQITLDNFIEHKNIVKIDLVKIDVEYYEFNVLKGAIKTLTEQSPVILCEIFMYEVLAGDKPDSKLVNSISKTQAKDIQEFMSGLGYYFYAVGNRGLLRVDNLLSNADGGRNYIFSNKISENLYIPYNDKSAILSLL